MAAHCSIEVWRYQVTQVQNINEYYRHLVVDRIKTMRFTTTLEDKYINKITDVALRELNESQPVSPHLQSRDLSSGEISVLKEQVKHAVNNAIKFVDTHTLN